MTQEQNQAILPSSTYNHIGDSNRQSGDAKPDDYVQAALSKETIEVNATIIDGPHRSDANQSFSTSDTIENNLVTSSTTPVVDQKPETKSANSTTFRHFDHSKIQSDSKDIVYDSSDNIVRSRVAMVTTTLPTVLMSRTTHPKTYSNAGHLDDVQTLTADTAIRRRHRRRR